jgi:cytoskeletal protein CcmA (bactofilin family)
MFSKTKEPEPVVVPPPAPAPVKRAAAPTRNGVPSIISAELIVRGTLISAGDVQVDGKVDGDIRAAALVIGDKAIIVGDVYAEDAIVRGRVEGSIRARKVQLCATCHVEGNILHEALSVESGAFFEGNCRHTDNPLADAPQADNPAAHKPQPAAQANAAARPAAQHQAMPGSTPPRPAGAPAP